MHVTHDVLIEPGLDALDDILVVDIAVDRIACARWRLDGGTPAHDGVALPVDDVAASRRRVAFEGAFQETPRGDVELERLPPWLREIRLLWCDLLEERSLKIHCRRTAGP